MNSPFKYYDIDEYVVLRDDPYSALFVYRQQKVTKK